MSFCKHNLLAFADVRKMCVNYINTRDSLLRIFIFFLSFIFLISKTKAVYAQQENCRKVSPCKCVFQNGSSIDLSSIGNRKEARWRNMEPSFNKNFTYFYNPCFAFKLGEEGSECLNGVAVCQEDKKTKTYFDCGNQDTVKFKWNKEQNRIIMVYSGVEKRITNVTLHCSENAFEPVLEVLGEREKDTEFYEMTLKSRCACPDLCHEDHLSAGSVLVIIFLTFVSLYLILGIVHSSLTRGAHGWELLPHYEFWADFPLLVRDGCVFVFSGCKPETAYERI